MAYYKYSSYLNAADGDAFDLLHEAGAVTPYSGIYRCEGCGREADSTYGHPLPPQNHHQHTPAQGRIRWRVIVMATHR
jgi:hypothetical protein